MGASKKSSRTNPSIEKRMWSLIIKILLEIFLPAVKERILLPAIPNQCRHQFGKGVIESRPRVTQPSMKDMALSWHSIMALNGTHQSFFWRKGTPRVKAGFSVVATSLRTTAPSRREKGKGDSGDFLQIRRRDV